MSSTQPGQTIPAAGGQNPGGSGPGQPNVPAASSAPVLGFGPPSAMADIQNSMAPRAMLPSMGSGADVGMGMGGGASWPGVGRGTFSESAGRRRGPEIRYIIYYDEDDQEITRKPKGPGRLPRGAYLDKGGNYAVKGCMMNNKGEIINGAQLEGLDARQRQDRREGQRLRRSRGEREGTTMTPENSADPLGGRDGRRRPEDPAVSRRDLLAFTYANPALSHALPLHPLPQHPMAGGHMNPGALPPQFPPMTHVRRALAPRGPVLSVEGVLSTMPPPDDYDVPREGKPAASASAGPDSRAAPGGVREEEGDSREAAAAAAALDAFLADWRGLVSEEAQEGPTTIHLDGLEFNMQEVLRAVQGLGGWRRVHSWRLVSSALLQSRSGRALSSVGAGVRVRQMYTERELHVLEDWYAGRTGSAVPVKPEGGGAGGEGGGAEGGKEGAAAEGGGDAMEVEGEGAGGGAGGGEGAAGEDKGGEPVEVQLKWGEKQWSASMAAEALQSGRYMEKDGELLVLVHADGQCAPVAKGPLVLATDGLLHHADVLGREGMQGDLERFHHVEGNSGMAQLWWDKLRQFHAERGTLLETPLLNTAHGDLALFALYHQVMRSGGLEEVVKSQRLEAVGGALGLGQYAGMARELRELYASTLYSFECYDTLSLRVPEPGQDLFGQPVKAKAAAAALKALVARGEGGGGDDKEGGKAKEAKGSVLRCAVGEGRFGLGGAVGSGAKRAWERAAGRMSSEDGAARRKRVCRALHSGVRAEVEWAVGVLSVNSAAAANFVEPHMEVDEAVVGALARFVQRVLSEPVHAAAGDCMAVHPDAEENALANAGAALTALHNFTHVPHLATAAATSPGLKVALATSLLSGSRRLSALSLLVLEHTARLMPLSKTHGPRLVAALEHVAQRQLCDATKASLLKAVALFANGNGDAVSAGMSGVLEANLGDLLGSAHAEHQESALSFIIEACQASPAMQRRLGEDRSIVDGLVRLLCQQAHDLRQAMSAKALRFLLNSASRGLRARLARHEDRVVSLSLALAATANPDMLADLARVLAFIDRSPPLEHDRDPAAAS